MAARDLADVTEQQLVRRAARGDRAAFEEFYRRTSPWLTTRLRRRCADDQIVAEVIQETYLAVWRAAGSFEGAAIGGTAVGWVWTIAARRLVDAFRRRAYHAQPLPPADSAPAAEEEVLSDGDRRRAGRRAADARPGTAAGAAGPGARRAERAGDGSTARACRKERSRHEPVARGWPCGRHCREPRVRSADRGLRDRRVHPGRPGLGAGVASGGVRGVPVAAGRRGTGDTAGGCRVGNVGPVAGPGAGTRRAGWCGGWPPGARR